ncbi:MAG TPA: hypothetical protein VKB80_05240 [Kofleriaceae bacterium]|nr:hypothetical protein [Kofleriaceae bacterium]
MLSRRFALLSTTLSLALVPALAACGGDDDDGGSATCEPAGGAVAGDPDTHCTAAQPTDEAACHPDVPDAGAGEPDAGEDDEGNEFGPTQFGSEGDEDECKYHVSWTSTKICQNADVTFTVTAVTTVDQTGVTGAQPYIEAFLDETHPAPNTDSNFTDNGDGTYTIGPVQFDAPGRWNVRFHFFGDCADGEESPHGHVAFFVDVP